MRETVSAFAAQHGRVRRIQTRAFHRFAAQFYAERSRSMSGPARQAGADATIQIRQRVARFRGQKIFRRSQRQPIKFRNLLLKRRRLLNEIGRKILISACLVGMNGRVAVLNQASVARKGSLVFCYLLEYL